MRTHACAMTHRWPEDSSFGVGAGCLLPPWGFKRSNSRHRVWWQSNFTCYAILLASPPFNPLLPSRACQVAWAALPVSPRDPFFSASLALGLQLLYTLVFYIDSGGLNLDLHTCMASCLLLSIPQLQHHFLHFYFYLSCFDLEFS